MWTSAGASSDICSTFFKRRTAMCHIRIELFLFGAGVSGDLSALGG